MIEFGTEAPIKCLCLWLKASHAELLETWIWPHQNYKTKNTYLTDKQKHEIISKLWISLHKEGPKRPKVSVFFSMLKPSI